MLVVMKASAAVPFAARALPALKPNQPNHSRAAPSSTKGTLCGIAARLLVPRRGPTTSAATRALTPAEMWTTVPPAKSRAPILKSHPSADQTQCASGA